jgi:hypothetical protein
MRHPEPDNIKNMESQPPANLNFWIRELPKTVPKKLPKKNYNHSTVNFWMPNQPGISGLKQHH